VTCLILVFAVENASDLPLIYNRKLVQVFKTLTCVLFHVPLRKHSRSVDPH